MKTENGFLHALAQNRVFLGLSIIFVLSMLFISIFMEKGQLLVWLAGERSYTLNRIFLILTAFGEEGVFILMVILMVVFKSWLEGLYFAVSGLASLILSFVLKHLFRQPRPFRYLEELGRGSELGYIDQYDFHTALTSMPSGHTIGAFAFFYLVAVFHRKPLWDLIAFLLAAGVGISRIYLGQHFAGDIAAGASIGVVIGIVCHNIMRRWLGNKKWASRSLLQ